MTKVTKVVIIAFFGFTLAGLVYFLWSATGTKKELPILGEPGHTAGAFTFTNQKGQTVTEKDVTGKITIAEFFFTTCPGICKVMNKHLKEVYELFKSREDFIILSHTVDPENDSVQVLAGYANSMNATLPRWQFLTGNKTELYRTARQDYLLSVTDTIVTIKEDFIHTEFVALLDKQRQIRGFYDATNKASIKKLKEDIQSLLLE